MCIVRKGPPQCGNLDVGQMGNNYPWEQPLIIWPVFETATNRIGYIGGRLEVGRLGSVLMDTVMVRKQRRYIFPVTCESAITTQHLLASNSVDREVSSFLFTIMAPCDKCRYLSGT